MPVFLLASFFLVFALSDASLSILSYLDNLKYEDATDHTYGLSMQDIICVRRIDLNCVALNKMDYVQTSSEVFVVL